MRDWLRNARREKGLTQGCVAKNAYITQPSYSNIEIGNKRPSPETAMRLGQILGIDWTRFFKEGN